MHQLFLNHAWWKHLSESLLHSLCCFLCCVIHCAFSYSCYKIFVFCRGRILRMHCWHASAHWPMCWTGPPSSLDIPYLRNLSSEAKGKSHIKLILMLYSLQVKDSNNLFKCKANVGCVQQIELECVQEGVFHMRFVGTCCCKTSIVSSWDYLDICKVLQIFNLKLGTSINNKGHCCFAQTVWFKIKIRIKEPVTPSLHFSSW